jgi:CRP-like cAMP-binding protein
MISDDYSNLPIAVYDEGSFFGDIEVFKNMKRYFSMIALTHLELLTIEKNKFRKIFFRNYPFLGHLFLTHFNKKWDSLQEIIELLQELFDSKDVEETESVKSDISLKDKNMFKSPKPSNLIKYLLFFCKI